MVQNQTTTKKYNKTNDKIKVGNRDAVVYEGQRGGKYVKIKNEYVNIRNLNKKRGGLTNPENNDDYNLIIDQIYNKLLALKTAVNENRTPESEANVNNIISSIKTDVYSLRSAIFNKFNITDSNLQEFYGIDKYTTENIENMNLTTSISNILGRFNKNVQNAYFISVIDHLIGQFLYAIRWLSKNPYVNGIGNRNKIDAILFFLDKLKNYISSTANNTSVNNDTVNASVNPAQYNDLRLRYGGDETPDQKRNRYLNYARSDLYKPINQNRNEDKELTTLLGDANQAYGDANRAYIEKLENQLKACNSNLAEKEKEGLSTGTIQPPQSQPQSKGGRKSKK